MRITLRLKPGSKQSKVEKLADGSYQVWVRARPVEGKANAALIELLAEHFSVPKSVIEIVSGHTWRQKIVEIRK